MIISDYFFILFVVSGIAVIMFAITRSDEYSISDALKFSLLTGCGSFFYSLVRPLIAALDWSNLYGLVDPVRAITGCVFFISASVVIIVVCAPSVFFKPQRLFLVSLLIVLPLWVLVEVSSLFVSIPICLVSICVIWVYLRSLKRIERFEKSKVLNRFFFPDRYGKLHVRIGESAVERAGGFALISNADGEVLLVRPKGSTVWELPGGGVEERETDFHAMIREVKEETGLDVLVDPGTTIQQTPAPFAEQFISYYADDVAAFWYYDVSLYRVSATGRLQAGAEIEEVGWFANVSFTEHWINYLHRRMLRAPQDMPRTHIEVEDNYDDILGYLPQPTQKMTKLEVNIPLLVMLAIIYVLTILLLRLEFDFSYWSFGAQLLLSFLHGLIFIAGAFWIKAFRFNKVN